MDYYIFAALVLLVISLAALGSVFSARSSARRLKVRLEKQFGQIPEKEDLEFDSIARPWNYCTDKDPDLAVDDTTWNDLDMNEVFARINACQTSLGEELLYTLLHQPDLESTARRETLIRALEEEPELRLLLQMLLRKVGKRNYNGLIEFIGSPEVHQLKHPWGFRLLPWVPAVCLFLLPLHFELGIVCIVGAICCNIILGNLAKRRIEFELPAVQYFSSALWCCRKICGLRSKTLQESQNKMKQTLSLLRGLAGAASGSMQNKYAAGDIAMFGEYFRLISLQDIRSYNKLIRIISANKAACRSLCDQLAELDVAIAVLSFRKSLPFYSNPHFIQSMQLNLQDIYHPILNHAVPNSVAFTGDSLITGSNASGKSTFMKAVAVNGILAAALNTCAARVYQGPKALVLSSMAIRDNLSSGESYFIAEIKSLRRILEYAERKPCLCIIDEILKGTNTVERIAASCAVLRYLNRKNCLCLVASHDIELTRLLNDEYQNYHFSEQITDQGILFDYQIQEGPSNTKNAIKLLAYAGYEKEIIQNAEAMAGQFEATGKWDSV